MGDLQLAVGFGAVDITPPVGLKMCGALEPRISVGTTDPLMAKSFVATDGERRLAIVGVDIVGLPRATIDRAIAAIAARTDLAPDYIEYIVRHGLRSMPAFVPSDLTDARLDALIAFPTKQKAVSR